jgi:V/A-type H+-transporting ATPase subunit C
MGARHNAYLATRVALMATRLLDPADLELLSDRSAEENRAFFVEHGLGHLVATDAETARHPLEQRIIGVLLEDVVILSRALAGRERDFIIYWIHRAELANLKAILRGKMANEPPESIRDKLVEMGPFAGLPVDDLLRTEDVAELLSRLQRSAYPDIARQARQVFEEQHDLFALDTTIDQRYYTGLARRASALESGNGGGFKALMAAVIDHLNLVWLLRYRFSYQLAPSQVWYLLIPTHYQLSSELLQRLVQFNRFEDVAPALPQPFSAWLADARDPNDVARMLDDRTAALAGRTVRLSPSPLTRAFAYLLLREHDLRNVHVVLKGEQLGVDRETVRAGLGLAHAMPAGSAARGVS